MIDQVQFKDLTHEELSDINGGGLFLLLLTVFLLLIGMDNKLIDAFHS